MLVLLIFFVSLSFLFNKKINRFNLFWLVIFLGKNTWQIILADVLLQTPVDSVKLADRIRNVYQELLMRESTRRLLDRKQNDMIQNHAEILFHLALYKSITWLFRAGEHCLWVPIVAEAFNSLSITFTLSTKIMICGYFEYFKRSLVFQFMTCSTWPENLCRIRQSLYIRH